MIELIVVLLVLALLAAIVVPTFQRVKENTTIRVVQTTLEAAARDGEAMAKSDLNASDEAIAAAVESEFTDKGGLTVSVGSGADADTVTVTKVSDSITASGSVEFVNGVGTITNATVSGGNSSPTTVASTTTTTSVLAISYANTTFDRTQSSESLSPTFNGGAGTFAITGGALPTGVAFNTSTGAFTGAVAWGADVAGIDTGNHTCAVTGGGAAKCWGTNQYGQIGDGTTTDRTTPVTVSGLSSGVASISVGGQHTCALTTGGGVKCWGTNSSGQLGDGTTTNRLTPVDVTGLTSGVAAISAGGEFTCAITTSGGVKCWGRNDQYQLGMGNGSYANQTTPVNVYGLGSGVSAISLGQVHACAVTSAGGVTCWGSNENGQLGDGTDTRRYVPVNVSGLSSGVASISAGDYYNCVVTTSGAAKCWGGDGGQGSRGDGSFAGMSTSPVDVVGLDSGVASIAAGFNHTCAVMASGAAKCWGNNWYGKLGDQTETTSATPVNVNAFGSGAAQISAGAFFTCVRSTTGAAQCWGNNGDGRLGNGTTTNSPTPVAVTGLAGNPGFPAMVAVTATASDGRTASTNVTLALG